MCCNRQDQVSLSLVAAEQSVSYRTTAPMVTESDREEGSSQAGRSYSDQESLCDPVLVSLTSRSGPARLSCVFFKKQKRELQVGVYIFKRHKQ